MRQPQVHGVQVAPQFVEGGLESIEVHLGKGPLFPTGWNGSIHHQVEGAGLPVEGGEGVPIEDIH